jgi:hypothetical protein
MGPMDFRTLGINAERATKEHGRLKIIYPRD